MIRYGDRRQPAYAWAFDRGDGLSNVGYGELLPAAGEPPPSRKLLLDQLELLLPGLRGRRLEGPPPPAVRVALGPAGRPGAAHRRRRRADQPDDRRGHLLRDRHRRRGRAGRGSRGPDAARTPARSTAAAVRAALGTHLKHTFVASRLAEHPVVVDGGIRVARRDRRVFDELVELGLGDGRVSGRMVRGLVTGLARKGVTTGVTKLRGTR